MKEAAPVQRTPVPLGPEVAGYIKVEVAAHGRHGVVVAGWCVGDAELALHVAGERIETRVARFERADVASHFGLMPHARVAFVLHAEDMAGDQVSLGWRSAQADTWAYQQLALVNATTLQPGDLDMLGPARPLLEHAPSPGRRLQVEIEDPTRAAGHVEGAWWIEGAGVLLVHGWAILEPGWTLSVEDTRGREYPLRTLDRWARPDVVGHVGPQLASLAEEAGFVGSAALERSPGRAIRVKAGNGKVFLPLCDTACSFLANDPQSIARILFATGAPASRARERFEVGESQLLAQAIDARNALIAERPVSSWSYGIRPASPQVSIIVPLFGRADFMENQLLEWARDAWLRANAEVIYVIDDPRLVDAVVADGDLLHRLYGVPFQVVWGGMNRGYSGANNLGASIASAPVLAFLNSDVIPQGPGWLPRLVETLHADERIGVVAPRLTTIDGAIQHAGMRFARLPAYGVWINEHPGAGLDVGLDPHEAATEVPAVTGACMLLRRRDFDDAGGWDNGYLIGDFEDSDLCLTLRRLGRTVVYEPRAQLTHLERQSIPATGNGDFRFRVTLWNALRHQEKWSAELEREAVR